MGKDGDKSVCKSTLHPSTESSSSKIRASPLKLAAPQTPVIGPSERKLSSESKMKAHSVMSSPTIEGKVPASNNNKNYQYSQETRGSSSSGGSSKTLNNYNKSMSQANTRRQYQPRNKNVPTEGGAKNGRWSLLEHLRFLEALKLHGKNWKHIEEHIATRTSTQARSHA